MSAADLERRILAGLADAQDAYEEFVDTQGWLERGFDSFADWWSVTVVPTMRALSMRPTREIAASVIARVREEEQALPPAQRRTQAELASLAGISTKTIQRQDHPQRTVSATADLVDPLPRDIAEKIEQHMEEVVRAEAYARADSELDAVMDGTAARFRSNFSSAMRRAGEIVTFDADRIAECYAQDFDASVERAFFTELERFIDRVREARRRSRSGLRVIDGGVA